MFTTYLCAPFLFSTTILLRRVDTFTVSTLSVTQLRMKWEGDQEWDKSRNKAIETYFKILYGKHLERLKDNHNKKNDALSNRLSVELGSSRMQV
jgi:hypothetical protein